MNYDIEKICTRFQLDGDFVSGVPHGNGHINDTFKVEFSSPQGITNYILQRVNANVFPDVPGQMDNIERVTKHIRAHLEAQERHNIDQQVLGFLPTKSGAAFLTDDQGEYWRVCNFIDGRTIEIEDLNSDQQAYEGGKAFGEFQALLSDLPGPPLNETIVDFHNGPKRYMDFLEALENAPADARKEARAEIEYLQDSASVFGVLAEELEAGNIPARNTHNDTKINNLIFKKDVDEGLCVIDLDTVMPGLIHYDFGDLVRTCVSTSAEDEVDLTKVTLELSRFKAIVEGYLSSAKDFIMERERQLLTVGTRLLPIMIGTRFLTDFLNGNVYFKTAYRDHNLVRCRAQFQLYRLLTEREDELKRIVEDAAGFAKTSG